MKNGILNIQRLVCATCLCQAGEPVLSALCGCKMLREISKLEVETETKLSMKELAQKFENLAHGETIKPGSPLNTGPVKIQRRLPYCSCLTSFLHIVLFKPLFMKTNAPTLPEEKKKAGSIAPFSQAIIVWELTDYPAWGAHTWGASETETVQLSGSVCTCPSSPPDVFSTCYRSDESRSFTLLIRKSPVWGGTTCLQMGTSADARLFFSHDGVQVR